MKIIRADTCRVTPWKNGGGSTTQIAVEPPGAMLDAFDWRISMARISSNGPFSEFAGIDRTLTVIAGQGLVLTIANNAPVTLGHGSGPIEFAGGSATSARLIAGEIIDLNVMTRRARFSHRVVHVREPGPCNLDDTDIAVVFSFNGRVMLTSERETVTLDHGDTAVLTRREDIGFEISEMTDGDCYLIRLRKLGDQPGWA